MIRLASSLRSVVLASVLAACAACSGSGPHHDGLRYGMSLVEARDAIGRNPCDTASWRGGVVAGFHRSGFVGLDATTDCRPNAANLASVRPVDEKRDLPARYAHFQLLFDRRGRLVADTLVWESDRVSTREGDLRGYSDLTEMPDDVYAALVGE